MIKGKYLFFHHYNLIKKGLKMKAQFPDEFYTEKEKEKMIGNKKGLEEIEIIRQRLAQLAYYLGDKRVYEKGDTSTLVNEILTNLGYINSDIDFLYQEILKLKRVSKENEI